MELTLTTPVTDTNPPPPNPPTIIKGRKPRIEKRPFKGIRMRKWGKWVAEIREPNKRSRIWLGSYSAPVAAARAYDTAVFYLRGLDAPFNFPDELCSDELGELDDMSADGIRNKAIEVGSRIDAEIRNGGEASRLKKSWFEERKLGLNKVPLIDGLIEGPDGVVNMSRYLRFPTTFGAITAKGDPVTNEDRPEMHVTPPPPQNMHISDPTDVQRFVENSDEDIVANRFRKRYFRNVVSGSLKDNEDASEGSRPRRKQKLTIRTSGSSLTVASGESLNVGQPDPEETPNDSVSSSEGLPEETGEPESQHSRHSTPPAALPHAQTHPTIHLSSSTSQEASSHHSDVNQEGSSADTEDATDTFSPFRGAETNPEKDNSNLFVNSGETDCEVLRTSMANQDKEKAIETSAQEVLRGVHLGEGSSKADVHVPGWKIQERSRVETAEECRNMMAHLSPPGSKEAANALTNELAIDRSWFLLGQGAMAMSDVLLRYEGVLDKYNALMTAHGKCSQRFETSERLLTVERQKSSGLASRLKETEVRCSALQRDKTKMSSKMHVLEAEKGSLQGTIDSHVKRIKELEAELVLKDRKLVEYKKASEKWDEEKEKLFAKLKSSEMLRYEVIKDVFPSMVSKLLKSHEYKSTLSETFNMAIQAGWGEGVKLGRTEKEVMEIVANTEGFDGLSDKKCYAMFDRLSDQEYPFIKTVSDSYYLPPDHLMSLSPQREPSPP